MIGARMPLPNLIVIGAQKSGTSSLRTYLDLHPEIAMVSLEDDELNFFSREGRWRRGLEWYAQRFRDAPVRGERSNSYTEWPFHPCVPERMKRVVPDAKFVYLVRDPIARLVSGWRFHTRHGEELRSFDETFSRLDDNLHVWRSRYASQLERFLPHFNQEQFLVIDQADLFANRAETLRRVFRHVEVDETFTSAAFEAQDRVSDEGRWLSPRGLKIAKTLEHTIGRNALHRLYGLASFIPKGLPGLERPSVERPIIDAELHERLSEILAPEAERLRALTGERFATWSI